VGRIPAFGIGPLLAGTGGLVVLCLLKSPLRWCGGAVIVLAALWALREPLPDVLVAADGQAVAVRGGDGRLAIRRSGGDAFTVREWLAADGDARLPADAALGEGFKCDETGCIGRLADGRLVARVTAPDAFQEDCSRASVVVTTREAPPDCSALVIDRNRSRSHGAIALRRQGDGFEVTAARPAGQDRPWAPALAFPRGTASPIIGPRPRNSTPRLQDLEPGD
jgi:competence protein ComEC